MCTARFPNVFRWPPLGVSSGGGRSLSEEVWRGIQWWPTDDSTRWICTDPMSRQGRCPGPMSGGKTLPPCLTVLYRFWIYILRLFDLSAHGGKDPILIHQHQEGHPSRSSKISHKKMTAKGVSIDFLFLAPTSSTLSPTAIIINGIKNLWGKDRP